MEIPYRPEIDGLRALAVTLVVFSHLGWGRFAGGFVGVDVFFVVSGYLITALLARDAASGQGRGALARFYARRVVRLAPAYFLVLLVTSLLAWLVLLPTPLVQYARSALYSTFLAANVFMWRDTGGYFGAGHDGVPLLHLWSLAVEEQFYLVWPAALLLGARRASPWRRCLLVGLLVVFGLAVSEWGVRHHPAPAYYLTPFRFFELMIGALVAAWPRRGGAIGRIHELVALLGLAAVLYAATHFAPDASFPGVGALVPCAGTAAILAFTQAGRGAIGRLLALPPLVHVGRISYPVYLWHWPLVVFLNLVAIPLSLPVGVAICAATLGLAQLTHRHVEQPARRLAGAGLPTVLGLGFVLPAAVVCGFVTVTLATGGFPHRFSAAVLTRSEIIERAGMPGHDACVQAPPARPAPPEACVLGRPDRPVDFLLVGDSHAGRFAGMLDVMARDANLRGYDMAQALTPYLPGVVQVLRHDGTRVSPAGFAARNDTVRRLIAAGHYRGVVLAGNYPTYYHAPGLALGEDRDPPRVLAAGLQQAIEDILASGARPFIVDDDPDLAGTGVAFDCTLQNLRFARHARCALDAAVYRQRTAGWQALLTRLGRAFPQLTIIRPSLVMCTTRLCRTEIDGVPLYADSNHLNHAGSVLVGRKYLAAYGNPLTILR